ncbi:R3H and coiled-coil domain-containing protein 1 [Syngnathus typhle]|uniref:R3H and coiled-coil domain-containing protein 1 n=1 Tax=Syngnathus typhle TaxID=161592 RepID=UPI002A6A56F0|nr:R3H and coiled-coil domain-containing protein 1 [Syngnathus typhle]XP_061147224.1 R3H and coiled-coil domain-containing protein 1 [Syngnathus typhle]
MLTLAFACYDGVYLPKEENTFVDQVLDDLETYQKSSPKSVLLFPPLSSRLRYLIHRTVEDLPELTTFSVGESWCRQVVVCPSALRGEAQEEDDDGESSFGLDEEPVKSPKRQSSTSTRIKAPRRPDKALYTPRAARQNLQSQNSQASQGVQESPTSAFLTSLSNSSSSSEGKSSLVLKEESIPFAADGALVDKTLTKGNLSAHEDDVTLSCLSKMCLEDKPAKCDLSEEIKTHLLEAVTFTVRHVCNDYSAYENFPITTEDFAHVIEIYDFPAMFKTDDLLDAFAEYSDGGMKITWVDDTHALGVFATQTAAVHALSICHPLLKVRTLAEGSKMAKGKAFKRPEFIQPMKERPKTDSAVARRMVARALGLNRRGRGRGQCI